MFSEDLLNAGDEHSQFRSWLSMLLNKVHHPKQLFPNELFERFMHAKPLAYGKSGFTLFPPKRHER